MKTWRENIISITSTEVSQVLLLSVEVYIFFITLHYFQSNSWWNHWMYLELKPENHGMFNMKYSFQQMTEIRVKITFIHWNFYVCVCVIIFFLYP